jgi:ribosomal protein S18 acetylase RimI-like enzyme
MATDWRHTMKKTATFWRPFSCFFVFPLQIIYYSSSSLYQCPALGNPGFHFGWEIRTSWPGDASTTLMDEHDQLMHNTPHLYVAMLRVSDTAQGKGIDRKALEIAIEVAGDMAIYLECHNEKVWL